MESTSLLQLVTAAEYRGIDTTALHDYVRAHGGLLFDAVNECIQERLTATQWINRDVKRRALTRTDADDYRGKTLDLTTIDRGPHDGMVLP